jgi:hypothetical protein
MAILRRTDARAVFPGLVRAAAALLLAAGFAACERDPLVVTPAENQLMVHGILEAGRDTVLIYLTETRSRGRDRPVVTEGVRTAMVDVSGGGIITPLHPVGDEDPRCGGFPGWIGRWSADDVPENPGYIRGCYLGVVPGGLRDGERYVLQVAMPDGRRIRGEARIPPAPELIRPAERTRLDAFPMPVGYLVPSLWLSWRATPDLTLAAIGVQSDTAFRHGSGTPDPNCGAVNYAWNQGIAVDSINTQLALLCRPVERPGGGTSDRREVSDSLYVRVRLGFVDSAFVRYQNLLHSPGSVRRSEAVVGLEGAVGIFTAMAVAERRLVLLPLRDVLVGSDAGVP